jgi:hypothetical protein
MTTKVLQAVPACPSDKVRLKRKLGVRNGVIREVKHGEGKKS